MTVSNTLRVILGGVLAVATYLQSEVSLSHSLHVMIVCVIVFLGTVGITSKADSPSIRESITGPTGEKE